MKKCILVLTAFCLFQFGNFSSVYGVNTEMVTCYEELKGPELDDTKIAAVKDIVICRDVASFRLKEGKIYLLKRKARKCSG
ncbi:MAG: hypothetical protein AB1393_02535 [Candidatus Edwardsbacteria bacterium]